jgi:quinolinate synthase
MSDIIYIINAVQIIQIGSEDIIFAPDRNLGNYKPYWKKDSHLGWACHVMRRFHWEGFWREEASWQRSYLSRYKTNSYCVRFYWFLQLTAK